MSNPNQFFPQSGGGFPQQGGGFYGQPPKKSGGSTIWIILGVIGAGVVLLCGACCGGVMLLSRPPVASAAAKQPFTFADVPPPPFPDRGNAEEVEPGVRLDEIMIKDEDGGFYETPGHGGWLHLYLPAGEHQPKSLPCVLIAPAGSTLLAGMDLGDGDQPEHVPYVKAGCAVLAYELDGPCLDDTDLDEQKDAFRAFKDSRAGLVNGRNALEYLLAKVPEVDPARIYAAGHSSAATHALLFAAHEPRLAGVMAYAPAPDLPKRMGPQLAVFRFIMPGVVDFVTQSSPRTHVGSIKCPTFLFHAQDDSNCPIADTNAFADELKQKGTDVKYVTAASGDHYDSMINEGIPAGIQWLKERGAIK
ncbi:MAG TPA: prolyl oligopeptidase family serine peptidase [Pirellulaceae bacterium]|nr:prolyl oligopeptidase family serine peptidase [Pirellulaceae bacterium]